MTTSPHALSFTDETIDRETLDKLSSLTPREFRALIDASIWYAKYHAHSIVEQADDGSAFAVARREKFQELHSGLRKAGAHIRSPL